MIEKIGALKKTTEKMLPIQPKRAPMNSFVMSNVNIFLYYYIIWGSIWINYCNKGVRCGGEGYIYIYIYIGCKINNNINNC